MACSTMPGGALATTSATAAQDSAQALPAASASMASREAKWA